VALGPIEFNRGLLHWRVGIFGSAVATLAILAAEYGGWSTKIMPLAVGLIFIPLAGITQPVSRRMLSQLWTLAWLCLIALVGALVSNDGALSIAVGCLLAPFVAFACGFVGAAGASARFVGVLCLVCYAVFMGAPESPEGGVVSALLLGLGGMIQVVAFLLARLFLRRPKSWRPGRVTPNVMTRLRAHWSTQDDMFRHGVRLAVIFTVATLLAQWLQWPHQYWIPMTVAWVTLPNALGTATRVLARVAGTLVGLAVVALPLVFIVGKPGNVEVALLAGLGALIAIVCLSANYAVAVAGVTIYVIALFTFLGDPVLETLGYRALDTVIAGLLALVAPFIWRPVPRPAAQPSPS